ncbi:MAG: hypothetical protein U0T83_04810 [Bacteriovoracaceae bacterium]
MRITQILIAIQIILLIVLNSCGHSEQKKSTSKRLELTLNHGEKWKVDPPQKQGMDSVYKLLATFKRGNIKKTVSDFNKLGTNLDKILSDISQECRMEGKAKEEFLELISVLSEDVNQIKTTEDMAVAERYYQKTKDDYENYFFFFEY